MNKNTLWILLLCLAAASCDRDRGFDVGACDKIPDPGQCTGDKNNPKVTITVPNPNSADPKLTVAPPSVCAAKGKTIKFKIVPSTTEEGSIELKPKVSADTWINEKNSPDNKLIEVAVPDSVGSDTQHDYTIVASDGRCLDPRIHVK